MARRPTKPDVEPAATLGPLRMIFAAARATRQGRARR
jgi:hypothetical protein